MNANASARVDGVIISDEDLRKIAWIIAGGSKPVEPFPTGLNRGAEPHYSLSIEQVSSPVAIAAGLIYLHNTSRFFLLSRAVHFPSCPFFPKFENPGRRDAISPGEIGVFATSG